MMDTCLEHTVPPRDPLPPSQVILPFLTESYASQRDPEEVAVPLCTVHFCPGPRPWGRPEGKGAQATYHTARPSPRFPPTQQVF